MREREREPAREREGRDTGMGLLGSRGGQVARRREEGRREKERQGRREIWRYGALMSGGGARGRCAGEVCDACGTRSFSSADTSSLPLSSDYAQYSAMVRVF